MNNIKKQQLAFVAGVLLVLCGFGSYQHFRHKQPDWWETSTHPIGYTEIEDDVHVHSDLVVFLDGERLNLMAEKYQSKAGHVLHEHVHFHDNNQDVMHRHAQGITLEDFFTSLGMKLTNTSLALDTGEVYKNTGDKKLHLFVNGEEQDDIIGYVNKEEDRVLLYYGIDDKAVIQAQLEIVTDLACIYSGTCPERGVAPPENCGLTCEL